MSCGAVYFDLGSTLATGFGESVRRLLGCRLHLSEKEVKRVGKLVMTVPAREPAALAAALEPILPDHSAHEIERAVRSLWREQEESVRAVPGAVEVLADLKQRGFRIGVISNTWHPFMTGFHRSCGLMADQIDDWLLSYLLGEKKPSGALFARALAGSALDPAQCWMVGDSYELDVAPALKAGMKAVWLVVRPERERDGLARILRGELPPPTWAVADLAELSPFFADRSRG
ncbi:MAG: HAD family hydrolase [Syntrophobacteraceae bacterium]